MVIYGDKEGCFGYKLNDLLHCPIFMAGVEKMIMMLVKKGVFVTCMSTFGFKLDKDKTE